MKYYIKLKSSIYEVKVKNGKRLVKFAGNWISIDGFINALIKHGLYDQIVEAAELGGNIVREKLGIDEL